MGDGPPAAAGDQRVPDPLQEGGHIAGQPIDADRDRQAAGTGPDHLHQRRDQGQVAVGG